MKKTLLIAIVTALLPIASHTLIADTNETDFQSWKLQFETGMGVTQSAYSDNCQGGEAGSVVWTTNFLGKAEKQLSSIWFWENQLKMEFGQIHNQVEETKKWKKPLKSADQIRYDGIIRLTKGWAVDPYGAVTFESQFLDASSPLNKRYINPIDLTEALGLARNIFRVEKIRQLTTRIGIGFKQHFAKIDDPADPNQTISETTSKSGLEWVTDFQLGSAATKASFNSQVTLFKAFTNSKADELEGLPSENYWKAVDISWENTLRANLTSVLQVNLTWRLLYDKELSLSGQFKETLTLGLAYKFANF